MGNRGENGEGINPRLFSLTFCTFSACMRAKLAASCSKRHLQHDVMPSFPLESRTLVPSVFVPFDQQLLVLSSQHAQYGTKTRGTRLGTRLYHRVLQHFCSGMRRNQNFDEKVTCMPLDFSFF